MMIKQSTGDHCNWFGDEDSSLTSPCQGANQRRREHAIQVIISVCTNPQDKREKKEGEPEMNFFFFFGNENTNMKQLHELLYWAL